MLFTRGVATREDGESDVEIRWQSRAFRCSPFTLKTYTLSLLFDSPAQREKSEEIISLRRVNMCFALPEIATFTERARKYRKKYREWLPTSKLARQISARKKSDENNVMKKSLKVQNRI